VDTIIALVDRLGTLDDVRSVVDAVTPA
jgi:hypothetical protein